MTVNQDLYNRSVLHLTSLERVYTRLDGMVQRELDQHQRRLQRIIARGLSRDATLELLDRQIIRTYRRLDGLVSKELIDIGRNELGFQTGNLQRSLGNLSKATQPPARGIREQVLAEPLSPPKSTISNKRTFGGWLDGVSRSERRTVDSIVRAGFLSGRSHTQIANDLINTGSVVRSRSDARALVRTAFTQVQTTAAWMTFNNNSDVISGYQWISTLDSRTSDICKSRDKRVFGLNEGVRPPAHFRCRSSIIPVVKSFEELGIPASRKRNVPNRRRSSFNGQVAATTDYDGWLRDQPNNIQDQVLGQQKAELYRRGNLNIRKFIDFNGTGITIGQLRKLDDRSLNSIINDRTIDRGASDESFQIQDTVSKITDLSNNNIGLSLAIGKQANLNRTFGSTPFTRANLEPAYIEYLNTRGQAGRGLYVNRVYDPILGEVEDRKYRAFDTDFFQSEENLLMRAVDNGDILPGELAYIRDQLRQSAPYLEGNQYTIALRTLRLAFERKDFDPSISDFNTYLRTGLSTHSNTFIQGGFRTNVAAIRKSRGRAKSFTEIRASGRMRRRDINRIDESFNTQGRRLSELGEDLPDNLSHLDPAVVSAEIMRIAAVSLNRSLTDVYNTIGRRIYALGDVSVSPLEHIRLGQILATRLLDRTPSYQVIRVRRSPGRDRAITKTDDELTVTEETDVFVLISNDVRIIRYYDNLNEQRIDNNLPTTPGRIKQVSAGDRGLYTDRFDNISPAENTVNARTAAVLNAESAVQLKIDSRLLDIQRRLYEAGFDDHFARLETQRGNSVNQTFGVAELVDGKPFAYDNFLDTRTRTYGNSPYLSHQGTGQQKSLIRFNSRVALGEGGDDRLLRQVGELIEGGDTFEARLLSGQDYRERLVRLGEAIANGDVDAISNRITWWKTDVDFDERELVLQFALEFYDLERHINPRRFGLRSQPRSATTFPSDIFTHDDNTASAIQFAAILTRNARLGRGSNVTSTDRANRPYEDVGSVFANLLRRPEVTRLFSPEALKALESLTPANFLKIAKHPSMTTLYGSTNVGKRSQIVKAFRSIFDDDAELSKLSNLFKYNADSNSDDFSAMARLMTEAIDIEIPEVGALYRWLNNVFGRVQGQAVQWTSPNGTLITRFVARQEVRNIDVEIDGVRTNQRVLLTFDEADSRQQANAAPADFIHHLDADAVHEFHLRRDFDGLTNHDDFAVHAGNADRARRLQRQIIVDTYRDRDLLRELIQELFATGQITELDLEEFLGQLVQGIQVRGRTIIIDPEQGDLDIEDVLDSLYFTS